MKWLWIIIIICIFSFYYYSKNPLHLKVYINNHTFYVDTALSSKEKYLGLSNRNSLQEDRGLLFIYPTKERYEFVMRNMKFPLDFIWISDKEIVDITKNVPVYYSGIIIPSKPVNLVLEVNAGTVDRIQAKIGDKVVIR